jgi:hypothetical protein
MAMLMLHPTVSQEVIVLMAAPSGTDQPVNIQLRNAGKRRGTVQIIGSLA